MRRRPIRHLAFRSIALMVVALALGTSPVMAADSDGAPDSAGLAAHAADAMQMTLARAPAELRSAILGLGGPRLRAKLTASDAARGDLFGLSIAISGSTAVVGADGKNTYSGAAYVFVRSATGWTEQVKLTAPGGATSENFGRSVAIFGSTVVVGAYSGNSFIGAAYVFVRLGTTWSLQAKLTPSDGVEGDFFGSSVALSGSTVVVGVGGFANPAAYVFVRSGTTWSQQAKLTASDGIPYDAFGFSVALSGPTAVVGAQYGNHGSGAAYVFARSGTTWSQQAELTALNGYDFGHSVAISGPTLLVGAYGENSFTGAAYVFERSGTNWTQQARLTSSDSTPKGQFGVSVAVSGSTAAVGASGYTVEAAYLFVRSGTTWSQQSMTNAPHPRLGNYFGYSVAIAGSRVVVGAFGKDKYTGEAYLYRLP